MTGAEKGIVLLTSHLGDPERRVLSASQLNIMAHRVGNAPKDRPDRELTEDDLVALGYGREMAWRVLKLLEDDELLRFYARRGEKKDCFPLVRINGRYPVALWDALGQECPGCLWYKGDISILTRPKISLVGSRDIHPDNRAFAEEVGRQAARQGYVLVSGNARGADQAAQRACLQAGGQVISVVADSLADKPLTEGLLYLSEEDYDAPFSPQRAISRNRVIHALGEMTFVAQCGYQEGGTWDGTAKNLRHNWSSVFCFDDGSPAMALLQEMGAQPVDMGQLGSFDSLPRRGQCFLEGF